MRPEPGASETAARLRAMGWEPLVVPLIGTMPTGAPPPSGPYDAIVFTSATAAREAASHDLPDLPVHAIGERTADAAREAGFAPVTVGANGAPPLDGHALGHALAPLYPGRTLLYPCAEDRRPGLEAALREGGVRVEPWLLYRTRPLPDAGKRLAAALEGAPPTAVLLHSPSAALALSGAPLGEAALLCLSRAVAEAVPHSLHGERRVALRPDEGALLSLLDRVAR